MEGCKGAMQPKLRGRPKQLLYKLIREKRNNRVTLQQHVSFPRPCVRVACLVTELSVFKTHGIFPGLEEGVESGSNWKHSCSEPKVFPHKDFDHSLVESNPLGGPTSGTERDVKKKKKWSTRH